MKNLLIDYVEKMTEEDIKRYAEKEGLILLDYEIKEINNFIKNNCKEIISNEDYEKIKELSCKIRKETYDKLLLLLKKYKKIVL